MIKILFHIDELLGGGAEKVLCNLVNNMDQTQFDITVHTTYKSDSSLFLADGIHYRYVYAEKTKQNELAYRIETELGLFYALHLKGDYDIEVAYLECGPTKVIAGSTNRKALKLAWVHCDLSKKMPDMTAFVEKSKKHYQKFDKVICVSENCKDVYVKYFGTNPDSIVVHNTIDEEEILKKASLFDCSDEKKNKTFVAVGRMTDQKNFSMLLRAHAALLKSGYSHDLWIVGDGEKRAELENVIAQEHIQENTRLWGFQSNPYPIMRAADYVVCSSRYEGFSTVVVEAMILGKPVLTVECTGMQEILGNSEFGMITENSEEGLYSGMLYYLSDDKISHQYQELATTRAMELSGSSMTRNTEQILCRILNDR